MIHYALRCSGDHQFDGWFRDSATFDQQVGAAMVACPECGDTAVARALMTPRVARRRGRPATAGAQVAAPVIDQAGRPDPAAVAPQVSGVEMPDQVRALLQKVRAEVERNCENVGERFADEARAIHRGTSEARGIYGQSTPEQAEALADEGISVARIPWVPRADG